MAMDLFLKIDDVKGESTDAKHKGEIELVSWSWGVTRTGTGGKGSVHEIRFTKGVDKSTPALVKLCCSGKQIKQAVLVVRNEGTKPVEYLEVTLEDAVVSSYTTGAASPTEARPTDSFSLTFTRVKMEYTPLSGAEPSITTGWNLSTGEEWA